MARSSYIYILFETKTDKVLGAFTVKHEMEAFGRYQTKDCYCLRFRDAQPNIPPHACGQIVQL